MTDWMADPVSLEWMSIVCGSSFYCVRCRRIGAVESTGRCYDCWRMDTYVEDLAKFEDYKAAL